MTEITGRLEAHLQGRIQVLKVDRTLFRQRPYMLIRWRGEDRRVYENDEIVVDLEAHYDYGIRARTANPQPEGQA